MSEISNYSRRVSFNERLYLAAEALKPGFYIQIVLEGEGALSKQSLEAAVALAAKANPGCRLVLRGVLGWSQWVARGPVPPVRVLGHWPSDDCPPPEIARPLPPRQGPTCEIVLVNVERPRLVFRCFHGVMDARGLLHFAQDVFRALRGEPLVGSNCTLSDSEFVQSMVGQRTRPTIKSDCQPVTGHSSPQTEEVIWQRMNMAGTFPGLVARVSLALAHHASQFHNSPTRIMIPVDLRNYKPQMQTTANMSYPLFIDITPNQSWQDVQWTVLKRLAAKEPMRLDPAERLVLWIPLKLLGLGYRMWTSSHWRTGHFPFSALVTHLALPHMASLCSANFQTRSMYFLPPPTKDIPLSISAVSSADSAQLIVSAPKQLMNKMQLSQLCESLTTSLL